MDAAERKSGDQGPGVTAFVLHPESAQVVFSDAHPFKPARYSRLQGLLESRGLLDPPGALRVVPEPATRADLLRWHLPEYVDALERAEHDFDPLYLAMGLGSEECPVFAGLHRFVTLSVGATLTACRGVAEGRWSGAFVPAGGLHHAYPDHAEGFCYANDVVLGALALRERGLRVAVVDVDAHHGNGTQAAFEDDPGVLALSMHESGASLYPGTGWADELGQGAARGTTVNLPLPVDTDDDAFLYAFGEIVPPLLRRFAPDVTLLVLGGDVHARDPLTHLRGTNHLVAPIVRAVRHACPRVIGLGAGGYDADATVRYWAQAWVSLLGRELRSDFEGLVGGVFLGDQGLEGSDLLDMRVQTTGPQRERVWDQFTQLVTTLRADLGL